MPRKGRTFKAEWKRLRSIARSEGRDPYVPLADVPWVPAVERLRRSRLPRVPFRADRVAAAWERAVAAHSEAATWAERSILLGLLR